MESGRISFAETNSNEGLAVDGNSYLEGNQKKLALVASAARRKRLSDITNTVHSGRPGKSEAKDLQTPKAVLCSTSKDYVDQLLKENSALWKLLEERNKVVEMSAFELQKLRITLQKVTQQNVQLAQANSAMLAELNFSKERLKALQHELCCTAAVLRSKKLELEEKEMLSKTLFEKRGIEIKEGSTECADTVADTSQKETSRKACNTKRKRKLKIQSMDSIALTNQVAALEKDDGRKSLRCRSSSNGPMPCEGTEVLIEFKDVECSDTSLNSKSMDGDNPAPLSSSAPSSSGSSACLEQDKSEEQKEPRVHSQCESEPMRRSSIGRPVRKAAERITSYKEIPLNVKMRRLN